MSREISLKLVARKNAAWVMCLLLAVPVPSFAGAWPQRRRGDKCQAQAMDVATIGGAVFGTSIALIFGPLQGKKDSEDPKESLFLLKECEA